MNLIEAAAKAFGGITSASWDDADEWEREEVLEGMARALAVFEGAHTSTDDEREALWDAFDEMHRITEGGCDTRGSDVADMVQGLGFHRTVQGDSKDLRVAESPVQGETSSLAVQPAIDAVRMVLLGMAERMDEFAYEEISSALDDIPDCENWTAMPHAEHVQGEPTRDSEEHLRGRWSNGDPVHIITDGSNRHVAPNLNGATWIPGAVEPYDRYAEHDRAKREGGYCRGCDEKFPAPQGEPSDAQRDRARKAIHRALAANWVDIANVLDGDQEEYDVMLDTLADAALRAAAAIEGGEHRG